MLLLLEIGLISVLPQHLRTNSVAEMAKPVLAMLLSHFTMHSICKHNSLSSAIQLFKNTHVGRVVVFCNQ